MSDQRSFIWSYYANSMRSAASLGTQTFGGHIVGGFTGWSGVEDGASYKLLSLVGHGAKAVEFYNFGPSLFIDDAFSESFASYEPIAAATERLAAAERLILPGQPSRGAVAIQHSATSNLWDTRQGATRFPAHATYESLRTVHYRQILDERPRIDWFEAISENFFVPGGNPRRVLRGVREHYPVVLHGVSLSIGSVDPLSESYLAQLGALAREIEPAWVSDHLCWSGLGGHSAHDLWPMPYTEEALAHVVARVRQVQERLGRRILLENVSTYVEFVDSTMPEWEFLAKVAVEADCGILLDVNNVFVSAYHHGFDARAYLEGLPRDRVGQMHLAGHTDKGTHLLDTHDHPVRAEVWDLYRVAVARFGRVSTLVEWDDHIPSLEEVAAESQRAAAVEAEALR